MGTSTGESWYLLLTIKCQESQAKIRFSCKPATQLTMLYTFGENLQQNTARIVHAPHMNGLHSLVLSIHYKFKRKMSLLPYSSEVLEAIHFLLLSACHSLKQAERGNGDPPQRPAPSYITILSQKWKICVFCFTTAWRQMQLSRCHPGLDGLLAHTTAIPLTLSSWPK